jgi:hypothetical protein
MMIESFEIPLNINAFTIQLQPLAPSGLQQTSLGQRPRNMVGRILPSPERAKQGNAFCFALSGLKHSLGIDTQGVALGWFVLAPSARSGRRCRLSLVLRVFDWFVIALSALRNV